MKRPLIQRFDYEWVDVTCERIVSCCDCGLTHTIEFRIVPSEDGNHIIRQAIRDNKLTAARRRSLQMKKEGVYATTINAPKQRKSRTS